MSLDPDDPRIQEKLRRLATLQDELDAADKQAEKKKMTAYQRRIALARRDFRRFLEYVIRDEETNVLIKLAEIHLSWIDHIDYCWSRGLIAGVLAPWGHGKSAIMEAIPLFLFGHDPTLRIKIISASDHEAKKRVGKIREYIDNSPEYKELFENVRQHPTMPWTRNEIFLARPTMARDASLESKGIMSSAIGGRADVLIVDDINDMKNTITHPMDRLKVWENYTTTFLSRRTSFARAVMIATRWHKDDVYGLVMQNQRMRQGYGWLVQRIYPACEEIECSYFYPDSDDGGVPGKLDHLFEIAEREAA